MGIMDLNNKEWSTQQLNDNKKCCADCKTTKTPLWRGGPAGPKTLCNACGIRYRKRRASSSSSSSSSCSRKREEIVLLQRTSSVVKKQRWKMLGEEEQAAVCLMALSCGFVFA